MSTYVDDLIIFLSFIGRRGKGSIRQVNKRRKHKGSIEVYIYRNSRGAGRVLLRDVGRKIEHCRSKSSIT